MHDKASTDTAPLRILEVSASGRHHGSTSRTLTGELIAALESDRGSVQVRRRDLADGLPFVDDAWIAANFTADEDRDSVQREVLAYSDQLVSELQEADVIVLGAPIYNFSIPAALKAWIDLIARAGLTFRYTENGPIGLLLNKKATVVMASGGVPIGSEMDMASNYLKFALGFIGISDVNIIDATTINTAGDENQHSAETQIATLIG